MGLGSCPIRELFDADVQLLLSDLEPKATARSQCFWLWSLREAEDATVKVAGLVFCPGRYADLDMMNALSLQRCRRSPAGEAGRCNGLLGAPKELAKVVLLWTNESV